MSSRRLDRGEHTSGGSPFVTKAILNHRTLFSLKPEAQMKTCFAALSAEAQAPSGLAKKKRRTPPQAKSGATLLRCALGFALASATAERGGSAKPLRKHSKLASEICTSLQANSARPKLPQSQSLTVRQIKIQKISKIS